MSHYHALRCDAPFCGGFLYGGDHGPDREPMHRIRADAKAEGWYVQVNGIAPRLRRKQGSYDFCPACVAQWDAEDAKGKGP